MCLAGLFFFAGVGGRDEVLGGYRGEFEERGGFSFWFRRGVGGFVRRFRSDFLAEGVEGVGFALLDLLELGGNALGDV